MNVRYRVESSQAERDELTAMLGGGSTLPASPSGETSAGGSMGPLRRGDRPNRPGQPLPPSAGRSAASWKVLERALSEEPRLGRGAQADRQGGGPSGGDRMRQAAGGKRWTLTLSGRHHGQAHRSRQPVGRDRASPAGRERPQAVAQGHVVHPHVDGEYVARMEDVLDLDAEAPDPALALLLRRAPCSADRRGAPAGPAQPGRARALRSTSIAATAPPISSSPSIHIGVGATSRSPTAAPPWTMPIRMRELVDVHYPGATWIRVVQDNRRSTSLGAV